MWNKSAFTFVLCSVFCVCLPIHANSQGSPSIEQIKHYVDRLKRNRLAPPIKYCEEIRYTIVGLDDNQQNIFREVVLDFVSTVGVHIKEDASDYNAFFGYIDSKVDGKLVFNNANMVNICRYEVWDNCKKNLAGFTKENHVNWSISKGVLMCIDYHVLVRLLRPKKDLRAIFYHDIARLLSIVNSGSFQIGESLYKDTNFSVVSNIPSMDSLFLQSLYAKDIQSGSDWGSITQKMIKNRK